jgi:hypothetical protein
LLPIERIKYNYEEIENMDSIGWAYSYYNNVRDDLSRFITGKPASLVWGECEALKNGKPYPNPMYHIINFADNEGTIGPKAVKEMSEYLENIDFSKASDHVTRLIELILIAGKFNCYLRFN